MSLRPLVLALLTAATATASAAVPPSCVTTFYSSLQALPTATAAASYDLEDRMVACFAITGSGLNLPGIDGLSKDGIGMFTSTLYVQELRNGLAGKPGATAQCSIARTENIVQPDANGRDEVTHTISYARKSYTLGGRQMSFCDKVMADIKTDKIVDLCNVPSIAGDEPTADNRGNSASDSEMNVDQLRAQAAYCYTRKMYFSAYTYYLKLLEKAPGDYDASYRIAFMTYYGKGCKHLFRKGSQRRDKAIEYMEAAARGGNSRAEGVLNTWKSGNLYF